MEISGPFIPIRNLRDVASLPEMVEVLDTNSAVFPLGGGGRGGVDVVGAGIES